MSELQNGLMKKSRIDTDCVSKYVLMAIASVTILVMFFIILFILINSTDALSSIGLWEFLTSDSWKPSSGSYGAVPVIVGTMLVTAGSVAFAVPIGLGVAMYMSEVASGKTRRYLKPIVELFAGIPSVVFGFFGLVVLIPFLSNIFTDQMPTGFSWLTGSILLGIMALPTIISVSEDALRTVPGSYRDASLAMGATRWETTRNIVVPAAVSGIATAIILGLGRAIGETMAVMMVTGNAAIIPDPLWNVFSYARTITASLALEIPEVVVGSTHYSALFLLGFILMIMVLAVNLLAKYVVRRTQRRFGTACGDWSGIVSGFVDRIISMETKKQIGKLMIDALVLLFIYMISSLFIDDIYALIAAFILTIGIRIVQSLGKYMDANTRQGIAHASLFGVVLFVCAILVIIIGDNVIKSIPSLSLDFITQYPKNGGTSGGIYPAIIGTLKLIAGTALIALPLGILSGTYLAEYSKNSPLTRLIRNAVDLMNGTPSVVFGLFGLSALVLFLGFGYSLIAGCITLALMILPVIIRTTEEAVVSVPHELREASLAMGATKWQTTAHVVLPTALGGIITGAILGLGRAAGETAPIMFTAAVVIQSQTSISIFEPVMALPYYLYYLATEGRVDPSVQYATALVLLVIVLSMFISASVIRERSNKKNSW